MSNSCCADILCLDVYKRQQEHQVAAEEDGGNPHPPRMGEVQVQGPAGRGQRDVCLLYTSSCV